MAAIGPFKAQAALLSELEQTFAASLEQLGRSRAEPVAAGASSGSPEASAAE
jgi:hypothetical protein